MTTRNIYFIYSSSPERRVHLQCIPTRSVSIVKVLHMITLLAIFPFNFRICRTKSKSVVHMGLALKDCRKGIQA